MLIRPAWKQLCFKESVEADAVLFVCVVKQGKLSFCCLVCCLVSEVSGVRLSVFVAILVILERIPVILGFTITKQRLSALHKDTTL